MERGGAIRPFFCGRPPCPHRAAAILLLDEQVLAIVEQSRITRFGFVDNEKYRTFGR